MVGWGVSSSVRSTVSVYYFNTVRRAVYYVLYVLIFIIYNTVFFIIYPCGRQEGRIYTHKAQAHREALHRQTESSRNSETHNTYYHDT